jgi:hypothetical protein
MLVRKRSGSDRRNARDGNGDGGDLDAAAPDADDHARWSEIVSGRRGKRRQWRRMKQEVPRMD